MDSGAYLCASLLFRLVVVVAGWGALDFLVALDLVLRWKRPGQDMSDMGRVGNMRMMKAPREGGQKKMNILHRR